MSIDADLAKKLRKLNQQHAYTTIQMHEAVARKAGLNGTDHKYIGFLIERGPMTAGELASLTRLTTGAITGLIDRLEKKRLVKRHFAENDRRKVIIKPNLEKIMALLQPLYKEYRKHSEELFATFSSKEIAVIESYLSGAIETMTGTIAALNKKK
jgi:DNA-binding MarR family transcriptional regulator